MPSVLFFDCPVNIFENLFGMTVSKIYIFFLVNECFQVTERAKVNF